MKKYFFIAVVLNFFSINAQNKIAEKVAELQTLTPSFKSISVLIPSENAITNEINKVVENATLATANLDKINEIVTNQYDYLTLEIPYQNETISVHLYKVNPFLEGFHVDTDKGKNISYEKGVYYRGIINGKPNSVASFNFFNGEFNGIVSSAAIGNLVIGKLDKPNNQKEYIVYSDTKMKVFNQFECHTKEGTITNKSIKKSNSNSDKCVAIYFEIDTNLFQENNSDTTITSNWMTSIFNNVQTLYYNDGISVGLKSIFIWTEADPYNGIGTNSEAYLNAFRSIRTVFDGDVGMLVGKDPGGLGGVAYLDTICTSINYSYSDLHGISLATFPTFSWTVEVITHEFGHSFGSPHTHACFWNGNNTVIDGCGTQAGYPDNSSGECTTIGPIPSTDEKGTIMSYCHLISGVGISFNNGFGPQPAAYIRNNVNNKTCLSSDCVSSCPNTVTAITASNITNNSVDITWSDIGSTALWEVAVTPFSALTDFWNTVTTPSYPAIGLIPNTYYIIKVRPLCNGIEPAVREKVFATSTDNFCDSILFTDTGGTTDNYTNMESWVRTMTPYDIGLKLSVTFLNFSLENNYDYLHVYNGSDVFSPDLSSGGFTGTFVPDPINSTAADGSLTFKFTSDEAVVDYGWYAIITCTGTLGIANSNYLDYSYYPNPTNGKVTITSKEIITDVAVYTIAGQLLLNQKNSGLTTSVDVSKFATGTYFFKLKFNEKEANFKVLKI
ncbi:MAG: M12 family metallo-peptidase [Flavobacterium sp.]|nr:M12 family metallo-peptidase [Flavobacterium sp.]